MEQLRLRILEKIRLRGRITFEEFMRMALYEPGLGYYTSGATDIGASGDFYTSPHLHPIFGALLGRQMEEMWSLMGSPAVFDIVEVGGGRGYLCKDIMDYLRKRPMYEAVYYRIVELNPHMEQRQRVLLEGHAERLGWARGLSGVGEIRGCVVSNEVLDALPVRLISMQGGLKEIYVAEGEGGFAEECGPPSTPEIESCLSEFGVVLPEGYRTEVCLSPLKGWVKDVSDALAGGFVMTIDYGHTAREYYDAERDRGTLLCYKGHRAVEDPYEDVGRQDITAHVNYSALRRWGEEAGLKCLGYCRQGPFLVSLGLGEMLGEHYGDSPDYAMHAARVKGLVMPGAMGDTHKVMVQYRGEGSPRLSGFGIRDQAESL